VHGWSRVTLGGRFSFFSWNIWRVPQSRRLELVIIGALGAFTLSWAGGKDQFWIALSYAGDGPQEAPAQWVISITYDPGLNLAKRLFHKPDRQVLEQLQNRVWQILASNSAITVING
jgi:hypothetical protein